LRRRRVFRVIVLYAVAGWIVIQVTSTVLPGLKLPEWTTTLVILLVALGFVIAVMLAWAFDIGPGGIQRTPAIDDGGREQAPARTATSTVSPTAPAVTPVEDGERKSIAVLPFVNMSGDAENEYFSDGIAEEILNLLVKLPQLKVASRTSSFIFKGKEANIPTVAAELGVNTVLEGSVRQELHAHDDAPGLRARHPHVRAGHQGRCQICFGLCGARRCLFPSLPLCRRHATECQEIGRGQ